MSQHVIEPAAPVTVPVHGRTGVFPVRRVYCVGRNYAAHAREMGADPDREPPFFFCKPADAIVPIPEGAQGAFPYPEATSDCQFEFELVVAIGKGGANIAVEQALEHVYGYAAGLDMTRRDLQAEAKKMGRPWETGKAFDSSAPLGPIMPAAQIGHPARGAITLSVNGQLRQTGDLADMIWPVAETLAHLSTLFTLAPGDLIFTGTPQGVGAISRGDLMTGSIAGVGELRVRVD